jgi:hypothetical protein
MSLVLAAAALLSLAPRANAWVAVRAGFGAAAVGVAAGAVAGAAVASAAAPRYYSSTTYVAPAPAPAPVPVAAGTVVTTLPSGCTVNGSVYSCGSVRYQSYFGSNGVYYQVIQ